MSQTRPPDDSESTTKPTRPTYRKTRFVCISDTHNASPRDGAFKLPAGDVLIHAGDLTNQGSLSELRKTVAWLEEADFEAKIVVAGNHDIALDHPFYARHGYLSHNQHPQNAHACLSLLTSSKSLTYLSHSTAKITLVSPSKPHVTFTIFGSPHTPTTTTTDPTYAFGYAPHPSTAATTLWTAIPSNADVVVTHTPPRGHCDRSVARGGGAGCEGLRRALWRARAALVVCGHVHEGGGGGRKLRRWGGWILGWGRGR
ncbi:hypothetical protein LTR28_006982 [Elasticomyces elasticus]|nr:hypothetical protein LTR28_006982 [Elasticomyces elasticus]